MPSDTRHRMIRAAAALFAERGYAATSFNDIIERSGAPRGSIYHHFPGGKAELAVAALRLYGDSVRRRLAASDAAGDAVEVVRLFLGTLGDALRAADFHAGCAVAGVLLDTAPDDHDLLRAGADALSLWRAALAEVFAHAGIGPDRARSLAVLVVAAAEGALMLCRAERGLGPLHAVGAELERHVRAAVVS